MQRLFNAKRFSIRVIIYFQGTFSLIMLLIFLALISALSDEKAFCPHVHGVGGQFFSFPDELLALIPNASLTSSQLFNMIVFLFPLRSA